MQTLFYHLMPIALFCISILILGCIYRSVRGPHVADRVISINMMTTLVSIAVCILALLLTEEYLVDVALVFSLLGCLAVIVLSRIFASIAYQHHEKENIHVD